MRAVFYGRKSNDDRGQKGDSIEQQKQWSKTVKDVVIVREFSDQSLSGNDRNRPGLLAMLAFCEQQNKAGTPIEVIVCWKANRFSRMNMAKTMGFIDRFQEAGCNQMLTSEGLIDFNDDTDLAVFTLQQQFTSHAHVKNCSTDTKRGKVDAAKKGNWNGGKAPFGYKIAGGEKAKKLEVVPEQAAIVRTIFELYLEGKGLRGLSLTLKQRGIKSPKGGAVWAIPTIDGILKNHAYLGQIVHHKRSEAKSIGSIRVATTRYVHHARENWIVTNDAHPAIVTQEQFDRVQKRMKGNRKATSPNKAYMLSGLLKCANCGGRMVGRAYQKARYYCCARNNSTGGCSLNAIAEDALFDAVVKKLEVEFCPDRLRSELAAQIQPEPVADNRLPELDARIARLVKRLGDFDDAVYEDMKAQIKELRDQRETVVREQALIVTTTSADELIEQRVKMGADFGRALKLGDSGIAKALLGEMISHIELWFDVGNHPTRRRTKFARGILYVPSLSGMRTVAIQACDVEPIEQRREQVRQLRGEGWTLQEIADHLEVTIRTITKDLTCLAGA